MLRVKLGNVELRWGSDGGDLRGATQALLGMDNDLEFRVAEDDAAGWKRVFGEDEDEDAKRARLCVFEAVAAGAFKRTSLPFFKMDATPKCIAGVSYTDVTTALGAANKFFENNGVAYSSDYVRGRHYVICSVALFARAASATTTWALLGGFLKDYASHHESIARTLDVIVVAGFLLPMLIFGKVPGEVTIHLNQGRDDGRNDDAITTLHADSGKVEDKCGRLVLLVGETKTERDQDRQRRAGQVTSSLQPVTRGGPTTGVVVVFVGLPGSGKSTLSETVKKLVRESEVLHVAPDEKRLVSKLRECKAPFIVVDRTNLTKGHRAEIIACVAENRVIVTMYLEASVEFCVHRVVERSNHGVEDYDHKCNEDTSTLKATKFLNALESKFEPVDPASEKIDIAIATTSESVETADVIASKLCSCMKQGLLELGFFDLAESIKDTPTAANGGADEIFTSGNNLVLRLQQSGSYDSVKIFDTYHAPGNFYVGNRVALGMDYFPGSCAKILHQAGPCHGRQAKLIVDMHDPPDGLASDDIMGVLGNKHVADVRLRGLQRELSKIGDVGALLEDNSADGRSARFRLVEAALDGFKKACGCEVLAPDLKLKRKLKQRVQRVQEELEESAQLEDPEDREELVAEDLVAEFDRLTEADIDVLSYRQAQNYLAAFGCTQRKGNYDVEDIDTLRSRLRQNKLYRDDETKSTQPPTPVKRMRGPGLRPTKKRTRGS